MAFSYVYCGAWNFKGEIAGVKSFRYDADRKVLEDNGAYGEEYSGQSILALAGDKLISVCELGKGGKVISYRRNEDGTLTVLDALVSDSAKLSYVAAAPNQKYVFVSSMGDGTVKMIRVEADGKLTLTDEWRLTGHSVTRRQLSAKVHSVMISPDGTLLAAANLGADEVALFSVNYESESLTLLSTAPVDLVKEPRHMAFSPDSATLYVLTEIGNRLYVFSVVDGKLLKERACYDTLDPDGEDAGQAADIVVSSDGRFVYTTNRGQSNIVVWKVLKSGLLDVSAYCPCGGKSPRGIFLSPSGTELLCANNDDGTCTVLQLDPDTGIPGEVICSAAVPAAGCVRAV